MIGGDTTAVNTIIANNNNKIRIIIKKKPKFRIKYIRWILIATFISEEISHNKCMTNSTELNKNTNDLNNGTIRSVVWEMKTERKYLSTVVLYHL